MLARIKAFEGDVSFYYKNLVTGATAAYRSDLPLIAASIIKLPMMVEAFRQFDAGELDPDLPVRLRAADKVPSCGVLTYLHEGLTVTARDLVTLSIIVSDNTATNLLMDLLTMGKVNRLLDAMDMPKTRLRRKLFDHDAALQGIQNTVAAHEMGALLEKLYWGNIVSPAACKAMIHILKEQQLNGKMPFLFTEPIDIAHKTGEDDGITHDVGIVFARHPFVVCFCANNVDVPRFNRLIQDVTWEIAHE